MPARKNKLAVTDDTLPRTEWRTPRGLVTWIEDEVIGHEFTLDAAADANNAVCETYYTEEDNALIQPWHGYVWLNPPYGKLIAPFMQKAASEWRENPDVQLICALVPDSGDTQWYNDAFDSGAYVRRFKHRIQFEAPPGVKISSNTGDSALFIWCQYMPGDRMEMIEWPGRPQRRKKKVM